jgi:TusA-related sulfurtransferase
MRTVISNYEFIKIKVDQLADARGIIFSKKLKFVEEALAQIQEGQVLCIYCSDHEHKALIPEWIELKGHSFLGIIDENHFFKILIKKMDLKFSNNGKNNHSNI